MALSEKQLQEANIHRKAAEARLAACREALRDAIRHCPECAGDGRLMFDPCTHQSIMEPWENLPTCPRCKGWRVALAAAGEGKEAGE